MKRAAKRAGIKNPAPHDLRGACARLCHLAGGGLEQIQFLPVLLTVAVPQDFGLALVSTSAGRALYVQVEGKFP